MQPAYLHLRFACCCLLAVTAHAGELPEAAGATAPALTETAGAWPTDRTITVSGHEFFRTFADLWLEQALNERYPIVVREYPSPRRGTLVTIEYGQERVYQAMLPASRAKVPALARDAVALCYRNVVDAEVRQLLFRDADLAPDELQEG